MITDANGNLLISDDAAGAIYQLYPLPMTSQSAGSAAGSANVAHGTSPQVTRRVVHVAGFTSVQPASLIFCRNQASTGVSGAEATKEAGEVKRLAKVWAGQYICTSARSDALDH